MSRSQLYKYLISDKLCKKFGVATGAEKGQSTQRNKVFPREETVLLPFLHQDQKQWQLVTVTITLWISNYRQWLIINSHIKS